MSIANGIALIFHCFVIFSTCFFLAACCAAPIPPPSTGKAIKKVWVVNHGWHTGIIVSAADSAAWLPRLKQRFPSAYNLEFGWGDQAFYQAREITASLTLKAVLWPTESVMSVRATPEVESSGYGFFSEISLVCFDLMDYHALLQYLAQSFYRDSDDNIVEVGESKHSSSTFYRAKGKYFLTNTCNKWTARGLQNAGLDIYPPFKFTADSIMRYLEQHPTNCYSDN